MKINPDFVKRFVINDVIKNIIMLQMKKYEIANVLPYMCYLDESHDNLCLLWKSGLINDRVYNEFVNDGLCNNDILFVRWEIKPAYEWNDKIIRKFIGSNFERMRSTMCYGVWLAMDIWERKKCKLIEEHITFSQFKKWFLYIDDTSDITWLHSVLYFKWIDPTKYDNPFIKYEQL